MVAGLETISSGTISIGGRCVNTVPPKDRDIAMVFQNYALYPHMTVYDNMAFGLKLRGFHKREIEMRVGGGGDSGAGRPVAASAQTAPGGQRQRVALGRAIVRKPQVFLFDEPLSNLDAKMRVEMRSELNRLHQRLKATMIYVTHDQIEAMTMGDRIVVMADGTIQQVAPPLEVYRRPANLFVAGFIGTPPMNVLRGSFEVQEGGGSFRHAQGAITLPARWSNALQPFAERELLLGFRPESLGGAASPDTVRDAICGTVDVVEPMGAETFVQVLMSDGTRIVARVGAERAFVPGTTVALPLDCGQLRFFDAKSGQAISAEGEEVR